MSRLSDLLNRLNSNDLTLREISNRAAQRGEEISYTTVRTYLKGEHPEAPPRRALKALAAAFDVPVSDLEEAATFTGNEPFVPDRSSDLLTPPQRTAVNEIIRLLADGNRKAGEQGERDTSPMNQAGVRPADDWPHFDPDERTETIEHLRAREQLERIDTATDEELQQKAALRGPKRGRAAKAKQDQAAEKPDGMD